ncbi:MAG: redoxin domain-containing protein [Planctomycetota bacterium]
MRHATMIHPIRSIFILAACLATLSIRSADALIELKASDGTIKTPLTLKADDKTKFTVLIFFLHDCPICNAYAPEIERIRSDFEAKGFTFYIVHTDPTITVQTAQQHAREYSLKSTVLLDPTNRLAQKLGATVTPQVAIVGAGERLLYLGRIDNLYADFGKRRPEATVRDLRAALTALASGSPAPPAGGPAVGCFIPLPKSEPPHKN